jgi:hypothetical protein
VKERLMSERRVWGVFMGQDEVRRKKGGSIIEN